MTLTRQNLRGTWGTVLLPIEPDEAIAWEKMESDLGVLTHSGLHGVYTNGSAGEFFAQTNAEFLCIATMVAGSCRETGLPFQIGANHPCPIETLERIRLARPLDPSGFQVILPDWFPVKFAEALVFLRRVAAAAAGVPLVLYQPPHAKSKLTLPELAALGREVPELIGVKVAGGDDAWYQEWAEQRSDIALFVAGSRLATGVPRGAHGSYSNVACLHPAGSARYYELMHSDHARALAIEAEIMAFIRKHIHPLCKLYVDAGIDKLLAVAGGWGPRDTRLRWPYASPSPQETAVVREAARAEMPNFFALLEP